MSLRTFLWPAALVATVFMFGCDGSQETVTGPDVYPQFAKWCSPWPSCRDDPGGEDPPPEGWALKFHDGALISDDGLSPDASVGVDNKFKFTAEAGRDGNTHHLSSTLAADPDDQACQVPQHILDQNPHFTTIDHYLTAYRHGTVVVLYNEREDENVFRILGKADIGEVGAENFRGVWLYLWGPATRGDGSVPGSTTIGLTVNRIKVVFPSSMDGGSVWCNGTGQEVWATFSPAQ